MGNRDLRVTKTTRTIKDTFLKQICTKPVNKITVVGLAREAEINKGTFYLHYPDIFALYDEILVEVVNRIADKNNPYPDFFTDPETFVRGFLFAHVGPPLKEEMAVLSEENLRFSSIYPMLFIDAFRARLYRAGKLTPDRKNNARLEYVLNGMLALLIRPGLISREHPEGDPYVIDFVAGSIRQLFPEFYSG